MRSIVKNASVLVLVSMALTVSTRAQQPPQQPPEQPPPISTGVAPAPAPDGPAPAPGVRPPLPASPASPAGAALTERRTPQLFMPDGQLKSHSIRVYVTRDITLDQQPRLRLLRSHAVTRQAADEATSFEPGIVAPEQEWIERVSDLDVRRTGTLMLFDLRNMDFPWFKAMQRVTPVLTWTEAGVPRTAVAPREVNLGNIVAVVGWTVVVVATAVLVIVLLGRRGNRDPLELLTGVDGHLSLAQTQVACWTIAVGGVVLGYGMVRFEVPSIPTSLVVLMGASLATGGIGYLQDAKKQQDAAADGTAARRSIDPADLIRVFPAGKPPELSLAKAQMLFWTVLLLLLFVAKSVLDGVIWDVPWPLVALLGFSQVGFLAPKLVPDAATTTAPKANDQR